MYIDDGFTLNLVAARKNRNLSRKNVADTVGVTERTVASWETGKTTPNAKALVMLADMYRVPVSMIRLNP